MSVDRHNKELSFRVQSSDPQDREWRQKYDKHIRSTKWKNIREALFKLRGRECEVCGNGSPTLELHHLNYDRLGNELPSDLKIVCQPCHEQEDAKRDAETLVRGESRRDGKRFNSWYSTCYGESSAYATEDDVGAYRDWKERKGSEF